MADLQAALQAAHDAGDEEAAMQIAQAIASQSAPRQVRSIDTDQYGNPIGNTGSAAAHAAMAPTNGMSRYDKIMAGAGQSVAQTGRGLEQLYDMAADQIAPRSQTLSGQIDGQSRLQQDQKAEDAARVRDQSLSSDPYGVAGNVAGNVAQFMVPGRALAMGADLAKGTLAARYAGAALNAGKSSPWLTALGTGATMGAIAPTAGDGERGWNTALGAAGGVGGQALGTGLSALSRTGAAALSTGAQMAADIAKKYQVPVTLPQLADSHFVKYLDSLTSEAPGSGATHRFSDQRDAFNDALGRSTGIPTNGGPIDMSNWTAGRRAVGTQIGGMARSTTGLLTPQNFSDIQKILADAQSKGSVDTERAVSGYVNDMFRHMQPVPNPLPGGPIASIPGDAWREIHTDLGDRVAAEGSTDLGNRLSKLHGIHMDVMENGMTPEDADAFRDLRGQYARIMTLQPLAEKAPLGEGIKPNLVLNRAIADGNAFDRNGNAYPLGELGQLAQKTMTAKVPNSGTPIRSLIHGAIVAPVAGVGAGLVADHEDQNGSHNHALGWGSGAAALTVPATMAIEAAMNRGLNAKLLARYAGAKAPDWFARPANAAFSALPQAGAAGAVDSQEQPLPPPPGHADGGKVDQYKKSSLWDLVQQGWKELTGPDSQHAPTQETPAPGTQASGSVGSDFDSRIQQAVDSQS